MQMIETKSSAIAGSCHSETTVYARRCAGSTVRSLTTLALMLSGLIVIGAIAPPAAYATATRLGYDTQCNAFLDQANRIHSETATGNGNYLKQKQLFDRVTAENMKAATNVFGLLAEAIRGHECAWALKSEN